MDTYIHNESSHKGKMATESAVVYPEPSHHTRILGQKGEQDDKAVTP